VARPFGEVALGVVLVLAMLAFLGSCAGKRPSLGAIKPGEGRPSATADGGITGGTGGTTTTFDPKLGTSDLTIDDMLGYIATPIGKPDVFTNPGSGAASIPIDAKTDAGAPTTFAVVGDASPGAVLPYPGWYQVALPTRPNKSVGWVRQASVKITKTPLRIRVDLAARRLTVENGGIDVFSAKVAVGTTDNPTPTGAAYVTELIANSSPKGAYGPYAFGLSFHSDTLSEFEGGDGRVGIHGTNQPKLIGQRVSHGCIRLSNDDIKSLVDLQLPLGVPVFIS
jgi:lipoprotein-anchoring transpeptidase ErfK/SrfK